MTGIISFYRYDSLSGRASTMAIDATTIESIKQADERNISAVIRTKSGETILVSSSTGYETILAWWREYNAPC